MRGAAALEAMEKRTRIMEATRGECARCGAPALYLAHRIPKRKEFLQKYGPTIVHHEFNLCPCCTRPECNDYWDIQNHPVLQEHLVMAIEAFGGREPSIGAIRQIIEWFREQRA